MRRLPNSSSVVHSRGHLLAQVPPRITVQILRLCAQPVWSKLVTWRPMAGQVFPAPWCSSFLRPSISFSMRLGKRICLILECKFFARSGRGA
jgi:hypothetical protein